MTTIHWPKCRLGHDMTDPTNVYTTPQGRRRCRTCKKASTDKHTAQRAANRMAARAHDKPVHTNPHKYKEWARQTWHTMSESDQRLVRHALANTDLASGESSAQWTTTRSQPHDASGSQDRPPRHTRAQAPVDRTENRRDSPTRRARPHNAP